MRAIAPALIPTWAIARMPSLDSARWRRPTAEVVPGRRLEPGVPRRPRWRRRRGKLARGCVRPSWLSRVSNDPFAALAPIAELLRCACSVVHHTLQSRSLLRCSSPTHAEGGAKRGTRETLASVLSIAESGDARKGRNGFVVGAFPELSAWPNGAVFALAIYGASGAGSRRER